MKSKEAIKTGLCILLIIAVLVLAGCVSDPEDVILANETTILSHCHSEYGNCEILGKEESDKSVKYSLVDKECNFEYYVTTYVDSINFDTTTLGYKENKRSNFETEYMKYIKQSNIRELENLESRFGCAIGTTMIQFYSNDVDEEFTKSLISEYSEIIKSADTRGYWSSNKLEVCVYKYNGEKLGTYRFEDDNYLTITEEMENLFKETAEKYTDSDIEFTKTDKIDINSIPDYSKYTIKETLFADKVEIADIYYFEINDTEYFITNVPVLYGDEAGYLCSYRLNDN